MQQHPQHRLIERKAPSQQATQKDRLAKGSPKTRDVHRDDQQVHGVTSSPLTVPVKNDLMFRCWTFVHCVRLRNNLHRIVNVRDPKNPQSYGMVFNR